MARMKTGCPGILLELDENDPAQVALGKFVEETLAQVKVLKSKELGALGSNFLDEFYDCIPKLVTKHSHSGESYSLLIRAPMVIDTKTAKQIKIAVMETKDFEAGKQKAAYAQVIECWWPGSENSGVKHGVKVLPSAWDEGKIKLGGEVEASKIDSAFRPKGLKSTEKYSLKPHEFYYYGQIHTFQIALVHEMIHAYYGVTGQSLSGTGGDAAAEEKKVVGIYGHENEKYTENKFRALFGMPARVDYKSLKVTPDANKNRSEQFTKTFSTWCSK